MFLPEAVCCCLQPGSFCMNSYHGTYISVWCMQKKTEISLHNLVDNTTTNCAGIFLFFIYHTTCVCVCAGLHQRRVSVHHVLCPVCQLRGADPAPRASLPETLFTLCFTTELRVHPTNNIADRHLNCITLC